MWLKSPRMMLAKTAESRALRKAFPDLNAAETAEEMEGRTYFAEGTQPDEKQDAPVTTPADLYQKALAEASKGMKAYEAFFTAITNDQRRALLPDHGKLKEIAKDADKQSAQDVEDAEVIEPEA
jgi:hypothetical protein